MLLENRVAQDSKVLSGRMFSRFTENYAKQSLTALKLDLETNLAVLQRVFLVKEN
jgi:hypothetical protein